MSAEDSAVCIIPARGGSKRIPDKNIREFAGKPIIAHSIETAIRSGLFRRVVVSTDSERIAEVAEKYGAEVPFMREPSLAGDRAGLHGVVAESLERLQSGGENLAQLCCLLPTAPLVREEDLRRGREALVEAGAQMSLSVTRFPYCIFRALRAAEEGRAVMVWPENLTRHSQDFPETFHDAGQFYWFDVDRFRNDPSVFFSDAVPVFLPRERVQDIDTEEDWEEAERLYRKLFAGVESDGAWSLRPANGEDCRVYWEWANDPSVRAMSIRGETIPWDTHCEWFVEKLRSDDSFLFVLEKGGAGPVGQIRFDRLATGEFEIDLAVASSDRGRGVGGQLLSRGLSAMSSAVPGCRFFARVKPENAASSALFERAGFVRGDGSASADGRLIDWVKGYE